MATATINIGANPVVRGSLKFTGTSDIGPLIIIELATVQFAPASPLALIGDEYVLIELEGQIFADDTGSFGTVTHPDDTLVSPNVLAYYVGVGVVEWQPEGTTGFLPLGNCQSFEIEPQNETLPHWNHTNGIRFQDFNPIVQQSARCRLHLDEWTPQNLKMYFQDQPVVVGP